MSKDDDSIIPQINYDLLVENALRSVVKSTLDIVQTSGLIGESHFFITFATTHPDVKIPAELLEKHPEKMTIILQHQFWDLTVGAKAFSITLSFSGKHHSLKIPYIAILEFSDPAVGFGLQFSPPEANENINMGEQLPDSGVSSKATDETTEKEEQGSADVVMLDAFRKKT